MFILVLIYYKIDCDFQPKLFKDRSFSGNRELVIFRRNLLLTLQRDSSSIRLHDIQQATNDTKTSSASNDTVGIPLLSLHSAVVDTLLRIAVFRFEGDGCTGANQNDGRIGHLLDGFQVGYRIKKQMIFPSAVGTVCDRSGRVLFRVGRAGGRARPAAGRDAGRRRGRLAARRLLLPSHRAAPTARCQRRYLTQSIYPPNWLPRLSAFFSY